MIGYSCKYAPLELIAAYGGKALMLDAETEDFSDICRVYHVVL